MKIHKRVKVEKEISEPSLYAQMRERMKRALEVAASMRPPVGVLGEGLTGFARTDTHRYTNGIQNERIGTQRVLEGLTRADLDIVDFMTRNELMAVNNVLITIDSLEGITTTPNH